jgi:hypothetical protein
VAHAKYQTNLDRMLEWFTFDPNSDFQITWADFEEVASEKVAEGGLGWKKPTYEKFWNDSESVPCRDSSSRPVTPYRDCFISYCHTVQ